METAVLLNDHERVSNSSGTDRDIGLVVGFELLPLYLLEGYGKEGKANDSRSGTRNGRVTSDAMRCRDIDVCGVLGWGEE